MNDFLDNLANNQHQKMLREISNDDITPKKRDFKVQNDLYERKFDDFDDDDLDYDMDAVPLAEF
jgi:phosphopantothenoylcysteine synthetase/decarboxylase